MIHESMLLFSADNSGAKIAKFNKVLGSSYKKKTKIGYFVKIILKKIDFNKKLKKRKFYFGLPIISKSPTLRKDGTRISASRNKILTFSETFKFQGTRIYGYILKELQFNQILQLKAPKIIKYYNIQL